MSATSTKTVDSRGRLVLGPEYAGRTMIVESRDGQILLTPAVVIPEHEVWLYRDPDAMASVQRGLRDAREGRVARNPNFEAALQKWRTEEGSEETSLKDD